MKINKFNLFLRLLNIHENTLKIFNTISIHTQYKKLMIKSHLYCSTNQVYPMFITKFKIAQLFSMEITRSHQSSS